jgi:glycosyltransferase involved in cell wall biosynthesis
LKKTDYQMRLGVDTTCWQNSRGYGRHARALLRALVQLDKENQYTFFMDSAKDIESVPKEAKVHVVSAESPTAIAASANGHRSLSDMWRMSRAMSQGNFDLLFFPTIYSYVPVFSRAKKVVMIHDIIAEKFPQLTLPKRTARMFWKTKVALGRWQADAIATVSEFSRDCLVQQFKLKPESVFVVGEANDLSFRVIPNVELTQSLIDAGITNSHRYVIYVGGFNPHKNLETLVDAFASIAKQKAFADVRLVMVGENKKEIFHSYFDTIKKKVEELGLSEHVIFTGYLSDEDLAVLLNHTTVSVLPSLMEGFGLPAVEAAACGCPVIATTQSPLPALIKEGGIYFEPTNTDELEKALVQVLSSPTLREQMSVAALESANMLTWSAAAKQMMNLIRSVMTN